MALYKRNNVWWINISHQGKRIQKATGTSDKLAAQQYHDQVKASLWRKSHLQEKPEYTWQEATLRWLDESQHKRSIGHDKMHLRWLDPYFKDSILSSITRDSVEEIAKIKERTEVSLSTVNRMLALIRAILRKAEHEWDWLEKAPFIRMRKEGKGRIRWLIREEVNILVKELPTHLSDMVLFTLATRLRQSNVVGLQWENVDLVRHHALIHPDQSKSKKAIPVPLNADAIAIIKKQMGNHAKFVFSYRGRHINQCNTKAWRKALQRAGIKNFRWHDLRHTWASWHVQNGTTLHELQQLGGWSSFDMVLRYAHLSSDHLKQAAERVSVTNLLQSNRRVNEEKMVSH
jgi:integrase